MAFSTGFSWQQLGAFIATGQNVSDSHLDKFAAVGGKWVIPVLYGDDAGGVWNRANITSFQARCRARDIRVGLWASCHGGDPVKMIREIDAFVKAHKIPFVVLNAEGAYQLNTELAKLMREARKTWPKGTLAIGHSTNSMNDSQVYNGRIGGAPAPGEQSFRDQNIHVLPQWYSWVPGPWQHADQNMAWVTSDGMLDNWRDEGYADKRAVAKSQIHGTLEVTGLEGASLKQSIEECLRAKRDHGLVKGISIYNLENTPEGDWALLKAQRGVLFS